MTQSRAQQIYALISANVDSHRTTLNDDPEEEITFRAVTWYFGNRALRSLDKLVPCVVMCRTSDPISEGEARGSRKMHRTRNAGFVFHIFGEDDGEVEYLLDHLIRGINVVCGVAAAFNQDVDWYQSVIEDKWEMCHLFASIATPVQDQVKTVKPTSAEIQTSASSPGNGKLEIIEPRNV